MAIDAADNGPHVTNIVQALLKCRAAFEATLQQKLFSDEPRRQ